MRLRLALLSALVALLGTCVRAQDLAPRAYVITPIHANAVTLTWSYYNGGLNFNGAIPVKDAKGTYNVPVFSVYHSFNFFGRSANVLASFRMLWAISPARWADQQRSIYRSGLLDFGARLSVNLYGGRALPAERFP